MARDRVSMPPHGTPTCATPSASASGDASWPTEADAAVPCRVAATSDLGRRLWMRQAAGAVMGAGLVLLWPWRQAQAKKVGIKLAQVDSLKTVGGSQVLTLKAIDGPLLLVRDSETTVRAINPMCTHKKCLVRYNQETKKLNCKCHKSAFELDGKVLGGPAKKDLATYPATLTHEQIVVTLPDV